jgi:hypothetical protein
MGVGSGVWAAAEPTKLNSANAVANPRSLLEVLDMKDILSCSGAGTGRSVVEADNALAPKFCQDAASYIFILPGRGILGLA